MANPAHRKGTILAGCCGACADKCHFYIGSGDSKNMPALLGLLSALITGLLIGNLAPSWAEAMKAAVRPELYVKTAIVILGGYPGVTAAEQVGLAGAVMFQGLCATLVAYLVFWAVVYFVARQYFRFGREWAAPLASGISICGVSAAMGQANVFRGVFFVMTFFNIGVVTNLRKLCEEGIGRLAAVYVLCLFGFIIWVRLRYPGFSSAA